MSWDPLQREVLQALGHTVYALASGPVPALAGDAGATSSAEDAGAVADPLLGAMLRAAGQPRQGAEAAALCGQWPPVERLRDPAAKRAMWPRLRALRARPRGR